MTLTRFIGWILTGVAVILASSEAIASFGAGHHAYIATGHLWTLLVGSTPTVDAAALDHDAFDLLLGVFLALPAWTIALPLGLIMMVAGRKRETRRRIFAR